MSSNYVLSLEPTFTQGLILGQLSILFLLTLILRHLFFDSRAGRHLETPTYHPRLDREASAHTKGISEGKERAAAGEDSESAEWFNLIAQHILETYRSKLRDDLPGAEGDEVVRRKVEDFANKMRPAALLDPIKVHAIDLGVSSPRLSNARQKLQSPRDPDSVLAEFDVTYTDTASISLSTAVLVNFPKPAFARLPVSLTISLSLFASTLTVTPPLPTAPAPTITLCIPPKFTLELKTTSLMGSRAKLADVPKVHELIQNQIQRILAERGTWKVVLPGLTTVAEVKEEVKKEHLGTDL